MIHRYFVWLHRWTGLLMTVFLIVVGLTGTLLAFRSKIDRVLNPQWHASPEPGQVPLDLATLAEKAESLVPQARPGYFAIDNDQPTSLSAFERIRRQASHISRTLIISFWTLTPDANSAAAARIQTGAPTSYRSSTNFTPRWRWDR